MLTTSAAKPGHAAGYPYRFEKLYRKYSVFLDKAGWEGGLLRATQISNGIDRRRLLARVPAFSPIAVRLLSVLGDERSSFKDAARLIALDPILAAEVLRMANSGLYGRRCEVRSILTAIAMVGTGKLSQIVVTVALWRGLQGRAVPFVRDWWRHSIAAALIAQRSSKEVSVDFAYTAALLHGVGQLALFEDSPRDYTALVERAYLEGGDLLEYERDSFGVDHAALARLFLESWRLPEILCDSVAAHHEDGSDRSLARIVQIGCMGAEHAGFGRCGCHRHLSEGIPGPLAELLAGDGVLDAIAIEVNRIECSLA